MHIDNDYNYSFGLPAGIPLPRKENDRSYENAIKEIEQKKAREKAAAEEAERRRKEEEKRRAAEQERLRKEAEERRKAESTRIAEEKRIAALRRAEYDKLLARRDELLSIITENKGLFGETACKRKEAKAKLREFILEMDKYPKFE